ncbi:MAG TPA: radical SAM protein, partial [Bacteroidota bacterium]
MMQTVLGKAIEQGVAELDITLIRPTNYTDDGYPIQTRVGIIRSNTLTQMGALVRDLKSYPFFEGLSLRVRQVDEAIQRVPAAEIIRQSRRPGVKAVVMLVGVQTNQYPRALDVASWFLPHGIPVLIGGFHVSGMLAMVGLTSDLREALCRGIILVAGEVEGERLPTIVEDVVRGRTQPLYNFLQPAPD